MKVISSKEMAYLEAQAYRNGSSEHAFMENAGRGVAIETDTFIEEHALPKEVVLLCGKGNNAGDAYVAGIHLLSWGYQVSALQIAPIENASPLCKENYTRFLENGGIVKNIYTADCLSLPRCCVLIDGIFGTGFHGIAREPYASIIKCVNASKLPILAIDIPSGLNGETGIVEGQAIRATRTIFLGLPKTGFFLQDGWNYVGKLRDVDFGLPHPYIEEAKANLELLTESFLRDSLPPIMNSRHKYQAGYVVGLGGSKGMPGAAILASLSTLRAGAGIVKILHPKGMEAELAASPCEIIKVGYEINQSEQMLELLNQASANFIGPGIGRAKESQILLKKLLPNLQKPCVIDADALSIIGELDLSLPKGAILTPHAGEMIRLMRHSAPSPHSKEFLKACQHYCEEHQVTLVLKGGPTFIFHPHETPRVNICCDPGMATAGSGDVLTGVIAAFLAQGLSALKAASLGVFIHGKSGEIAAKIKTSYCLIASDIIENLPSAFRQLIDS